MTKGGNIKKAAAAGGVLVAACAACCAPLIITPVVAIAAAGGAGLAVFGQIAAGVAVLAGVVGYVLWRKRAASRKPVSSCGCGTPAN
jgi:hypothetical protein